jgi:pimeloyl-ACP methyl ester carboxylesterase
MVAAEVPSKFAKLDGIRIHYKSYGSGSKAAVFIHGWTCDQTFWRLQAPVYENRRSLLIDLPGHGRSDKPEIDYTQELFVRAVEAVMRDAGVESAVLIGHSMGLAVSAQFLRMFPDKVSALVIVDGFMPPPPKDDTERQKANAQREAMIKTWRSPDYKTAFVKMIDSMSSPAHTPAALRDEIRTKMTATPQHVVAGAMKGIFTMAPLSGNDRFTIPTLAVMARRQGRVGYDEFLRKYFPELEYQEWPGVGHFLMMEAPEKFNTTLAAFLDKK